MSDTRTITVTIPEQVALQFKARARLQEQTLGQAASEAIRAWLAQPERERPADPYEWLEPLREMGAKGVQAANCLMRHRVADRDALDIISDDDLLKMRNFGQSHLLLLYRIGWRP